VKLIDLAADMGRPDLGREVRHGYLRSFQEAGILEEPRLEPVEERGARRRLVRERRCSASSSTMQMANRQRNWLGAVVELVAPAAIEQAAGEAEIPPVNDRRGWDDDRDPA